MRVFPVVLGCGLIAFGLLALLGGTLVGGDPNASIVDQLIGLPGLMLGGGGALLLYGFTEDDARKQ